MKTGSATLTVIHHWQEPPTETGDDERDLLLGKPTVTPMTGGWERHLAPDGRNYFFNPETKESKWSVPNIVAVKSLASKWVKKTRAGTRDARPGLDTRFVPTKCLFLYS